MWAGGISEVRRIVALAAASGVEVCPHTDILAPSLHLLAASAPAEATLLEFPVYEETFPAQFFLKNPVRAEGPGVPGVALPESPGLGMDWDDAKIESQGEVTFA